MTEKVRGMLAAWISGEQARVPWVAVEGNHDGEAGITRRSQNATALADPNGYQAVAAYLLTQPMGVNVPGVQDVYGNTNFVVSVLGADGTPDEEWPLLNLFMIDSNSYSTNSAVDGYGWVHNDQVSWFLAQSAVFKQEALAAGRPQPPALAYQHIPLPEHQYVLSEQRPIVGQYHETVCCPAINTGLHAAFVEAGDVKAVTVGHDHTNDYCSASPLNGVTVCYDGHGSYGASGYGEPDWPIRARVWSITHFGSLIETWKRLDTLAGGAFPARNASTIDLQTVFSALPVAGLATSQTGGNPACPPGYAPVDVDMNKGAGGTYSYLCVEGASSAAAAFVSNITTAVAPLTGTPVCPPGWTRVPGNVKEGTAAGVVMNFCFTTASSGPVVTDVVVAQGGAAFPVPCPAGYTRVGGDLSAGVGEPENACARLEDWGVAARRVVDARAAAARRPARWHFSTHRPADKAPRALPPRRRAASKE